MDVSTAAGLGGLGFVLLAVGVNAAYLRGGLPLPGAAGGPDAATAAYAAAGSALRRPSVLAPASWVATSVFATGLLAVLWRGGAGSGAWALLGFAGVIMQNVTFTGVEALRFEGGGFAKSCRGCGRNPRRIDHSVGRSGASSSYGDLCTLSPSLGGVGNAVSPRVQTWRRMVISR